MCATGSPYRVGLKGMALRAGEGTGMVTQQVWSPHKRKKRRKKMPTREAMRSLAEDIIGSYADRVAGIAQLRETVKLDLKGFQDSRIAMAKELHADLSKVRPALAEDDRQRQGEAREFMGELAKDDRQRQSEAREFMGELARVIAEGKTAVKAQLKELDNAHQAMSTQLRADLAKDERQRQAEAREFRGELARVIAEGKAAVKSLLKELDDAHATMSTQLKADLTKGEEERLREARALKQELVRGVAEIKSAVSAQLKEFADIQAGARDEWQKLTATMQSKRGGVAVAVKPPAREAVGITPKAATLHNQVFQYLANHPDGTKLVKLEKEFGVARIKMARVLKDIMDEGEVKKRDLHYFAI